MNEDACIAIAKMRWKCKAHRIPEATSEHPQYLFTRDTVEAIGVAHYREIDTPFLQCAEIDFSPQLWARARFLASSLAFVSIVLAPDGLYYATVRDFDREGVAIKPRQLGIDSRAKFVLPREMFRELRPDGARIGPGSRAA